MLRVRPEPGPVRLQRLFGLHLAAACLPPLFQRQRQGPVIAHRLKLNPLLHQLAVINPLRTPGPLQRDIGLPRPFSPKTPKNPKRLPNPVLEPPALSTRMPQCHHHMQMRVLFPRRIRPRIMAHPVHNRAPRRKAALHKGPPQRDLLRFRQFLRKRDNQFTGQTRPRGVSVMRLFKRFHIVPEPLRYPAHRHHPRGLRRLPPIKQPPQRLIPVGRHQPVRRILRQGDLRMGHIRLHRIVKRLSGHIRLHTPPVTVGRRHHSALTFAALDNPVIEIINRHGATIAPLSNHENDCVNVRYTISGRCTPSNLLPIAAPKRLPAHV